MEISPHCTNSPWNLAEHNVFCNTSIHGPQAGACEAVVRFCGEKCQDDGAIHQRRCWPSQQGNRLIEEPGHPSGELLTCTCMPGLLVCNCIPESCCCVQAGGGGVLWLVAPAFMQQAAAVGCTRHDASIMWWPCHTNCCRSHRTHPLSTLRASQAGRSVCSSSSRRLPHSTRSVAAAAWSNRLTGACGSAHAR